VKNIISLVFFLTVAVALNAQAPKPYKYMEYLKSTPRTIYFRDSVFAIESMRPFEKNGYGISDFTNEFVSFQIVKLVPDSHLFRLIGLRSTRTEFNVVEPKEPSQLMALDLTYIPSGSILYTEFTTDAKLFLDIIKFSKTAQALDSIAKFKEFTLEDENYSVLFFSANIDLGFGAKKKMFNLMVFSKHKYESAIKPKYTYKVDVQEADLFYTKNQKHDTLFFSPSKGILNNTDALDSLIHKAAGEPLFCLEMLGTRVYSSLDFIAQTLDFDKEGSDDSKPYSFVVNKTDKMAFQVDYEYFTEDLEGLLKDIPTIKSQIETLCGGFGITVPAEVTNFLNTYKTQEYFVKLYTVGDYAARFKLINFHENKRIILTIASKGAIKQ